jgi:hypothetical protein
VVWGAPGQARRLPDSEGGPGRRTDRKADTAPRADPYVEKVRDGGRVRRNHQATLDAVGLKKGSVMRAVEGLLARGDAIPGQGSVPRLTDPLVEHCWRRARAPERRSPDPSDNKLLRQTPDAGGSFTDELLPGSGPEPRLRPAARRGTPA